MRKVFLDTSFILAYVNSNDELHENALRLEEAENILSQDCYINNNVLNEVLTLTGRRLNIDAAEEIDVTISASDLCDILKKQFTGDFSYSGATGNDITWEKNGYVKKSAVKYTLKEANSASEK